MSTEIERVVGTIGPEVTLTEEVPMVRQERWEELRRLWRQERVPIAELARRFELDRKTVRRCLRETAWRPYQRPASAERLLTTHAEDLRNRAPKVRYSAQILFQELRQHGYRGSYETVKRFVRPSRTARLLAEGTVTRFETPPGAQSQIDWGLRWCASASSPGCCTSSCSRWDSVGGFYQTCPNETLPQFLDAHERAFEHFGGHTREHLYDRPRTVCQGAEQGRIIWNSTFRAFAEYWGFEPRLCRPYRAQTKGYASYCTSLVGSGADLLRRAQAERPFHLYRIGASASGGSNRYCGLSS
jgi:transposase